jgi:hypothetical protein
MFPVVPLNVSPVGRIPVSVNAVAFAVSVGTKVYGVPRVADAVGLFVNIGEPSAVTNQLAEVLAYNTVVPFLVVTSSEYSPVLFAVTAGIV